MPHECPIGSAERRLRDSVKLWEEALDHYFDPEAFRVKLQAAIQGFRSVTFLLQAQKAHLHGFDAWYAEHQTAMRADVKMRWLVDARNFIEKQGDLSTRSSFRVVFSNSWADERVTEYPLAPDVMPKDVATLIANAIPSAKINEEALLRLDRAWVDSLLPNEEVLTTLIHCYLVLRDIVSKAHALVPSASACEFIAASARNEGLPAPMRGVSFPRTAWYKVRNGALESYSVRSEIVSREAVARAMEDPALKTAAQSVAKHVRLSGTFREICDGYFQIACAVVERDGFHNPFAFFEADGRPQMWGLWMPDRAGKHIMMRELASVCRRYRAKWCIVIAEAWFARINVRRGPHASDYPDRRDALMLQGVHEDGTQLTMMALFSRVGKGAIVGEKSVDDRRLPGAIWPIVQAIIKRS